MDEVKSWWDIAQKIGSGAAFVLGLVAWKFWLRLQDEWGYQRQRDRETLTVLAEMVSAEKESFNVELRREEKVLSAIADLKSTILNHAERERRP